MAGARKQFEETVDQGRRIEGRNTVVQIVMDTPIEGKNEPRKTAFILILGRETLLRSSYMRAARHEKKGPRILRGTSSFGM